MSLRWFAVLAFHFASILTAFESVAQRTTGTISGTVRDETGAVLPGVIIELAGEHVAGVRTTVSGSEGFYRFIDVPPGTYKLSFSLPGFALLTREGVRVFVGQDTNESVLLVLSAIGESITVAAESGAVDLRSSKSGSNFDREYVENAPLRRFTFFDLVNAAPGVNQSSSTSSGSTVLGSSADENSYQMDGIDFTAPLTGAAWPWPNTDAIEEIEVLSLGAPAEYGNVSGAVFNVVTRQGSNSIRGDANFYFQSDSLTGRNTEDEEDGGFPYHRERFHDLTGQVGGPIVPDRLWFFASYQYQRDYASESGVDPLYFTRTENDRVFGKINWQLNPSNRLQVAFHRDAYYLPETPTAVTAPSTISVESGDSPSPSVAYTAVLSSETVLEARYSGFYGDDHGDPIQEGEPRIKPRFVDLATGGVTGGILVWYDSSVWKTGASGKITHFADDFLGGSHDFKFGVQFNRGGSDAVVGYNDVIYTYDSYGYQYAYGYRNQPYSYGGIATGIGLFADDTFRVSDRLTLNLGVRFDRNRASIPEAEELDAGGGATGVVLPAVDDLYTWNSVSPRLGLVLDLAGDGKTALKAHYGRYYRGIITGEYALALGASPRKTFTGAYDLDAGEFTDLVEVESNTNFGVSESYGQPYTDQFTIGLSHELASDLALSFSYAKKRGRSYPAWQDVRGVYEETSYVDDQGADATGASIPVLALVGDPADRFFEMSNPSFMKTDIDAITLQAVKRMADRWQLAASLSWQDANGLLPSSGRRSSANSLQSGSLVFDDFGQNPNDFVNAEGTLIGERPWTVKTQLVYLLPADFVLGLNYIYQSGRPWGRTARVPDLGLVTEIRAEPVDGSRRVSDWNVLDLRIQKDFALSGSVRLGLFGDFFNVFNNDAHETVLDQLGTSESFGIPAGYLLPRRLQIGAKVRF